MKIVFKLGELAAAIETAAGGLFEETGGDLGDEGLKLTSLNPDTQELLFTLTSQDNVLIDMSPTVIDESAPAPLDPDVSPVDAGA